MPWRETERQSDHVAVLFFLFFFFTQKKYDCVWKHMYSGIVVHSVPAIPALSTAAGLRNDSRKFQTFIYRLNGK